MKIAVFIAGPYRYSDLVLRSLERILFGYEYDAFFHIWKEDLGNKKRNETHKDYMSVLNHKKTKLFLLADPYREEEYINSIGIETNSNSSINATMGMFMSMNILCHSLEQLPDAHEYTHILRIRTDCLIYHPIASLIQKKPNAIWVSNNFTVPSSWISDHIMLCPKKMFYKFWKFKSMEGVYKAYTKGKRNPEKTLSVLGKRLKHKNLVGFNRYFDYQILYSKPKENDPNWLKDIMKFGTIKEVFEKLNDKNFNPTYQFDKTQLRKSQELLFDHLSLKERILKKLSRIKNGK